MNIIKDKAFEPARTLVESKLKAVMAGRIKIGSGSGADGGHLPPNKTICIMEATAYILGYDDIDDTPPCTSEVIRDFLIGVNDLDITMRQRARLKTVIPDIVNTAPTRWGETGFGEYARPVLVTVEDDERYKHAEGIRMEMLDLWCEKNSTKDRSGESNGDWGMRIVNGNVSMSRVIEITREMAAVAKFDKENAEADLIPPTKED